jgi:Inositol monophosphatase family
METHLQVICGMGCKPSASMAGVLRGNAAGRGMQIMSPIMLVWTQRCEWSQRSASCACRVPEAPASAQLVCLCRCIDPLDGTTNFAHGYPSFATSVGVLHDGVPVAGVVIEFTGGAPHCSCNFGAV